jgi:hypothetical protein
MKQRIFIFQILFLLSMAVLSSCYYDNEEELYPNGSNCDVSNIDYQTVIKPIFETKCATSGCHVSGTGRKNLSTDQGIQDIVNDGRLEERVLIRKDMPPSQPLSSCEIAYLKEWLKNGAPIN